MTESFYSPKILAFIYSKEIDNYNFSFYADKQSKFKIDPRDVKYTICSGITLLIFQYEVKHDNTISKVHHINVTPKKPQQKPIKININSTILEIFIDDRDSVELNIDFKSFKEHANMKALFKFATSKLSIKKTITPELHFLFNVQPNGRILSQNELLNFSKEFIMWFPTLIIIFDPEKKSSDTDNFYTEYIFFLYQKFWHNKLFGATSLIFTKYQLFAKAENKERIPKYIKDKIKDRNYFLPIDLEFPDINFAIENLDLISMNIITFNGAYLAFLAGYQVSLHSKFTEITTEWMNDVEDIDMNNFAEIYCGRISATLFGREYKVFKTDNKVQMGQTTPLTGVIHAFNEFAKIFIKNKPEDAISVIEEYSKNENEYVKNSIKDLKIILGINNK